MARKVVWPTPYELLVIHICNQASLTSAVALLVGNDPWIMGVTGLWVGFATGMPVYLGYLLVALGRQR